MLLLIISYFPPNRPKNEGLQDLWGGLSNRLWLLYLTSRLSMLSITKDHLTHMLYNRPIRLQIYISSRCTTGLYIAATASSFVKCIQNCQRKLPPSKNLDMQRFRELFRGSLERQRKSENVPHDSHINVHREAREQLQIQLCEFICTIYSMKTLNKIEYKLESVLPRRALSIRKCTNLSCHSRI